MGPKGWGPITKRCGSMPMQNAPPKYEAADSSGEPATLLRMERVSRMGRNVAGRRTRSVRSAVVSAIDAGAGRGIVGRDDCGRSAAGGKMPGSNFAKHGSANRCRNKSPE